VKTNNAIVSRKDFFIGIYIFSNVTKDCEFKFRILIEKTKNMTILPPFEKIEKRTFDTKTILQPLNL